MKFRKTLGGAASIKAAWSCRQGGHLPEPLLETTFTLLDSVMHSRNNRGLGGLIFPPSSQSRGKNTGKGREKERKAEVRQEDYCWFTYTHINPNIN